MNKKTFLLWYEILNGIFNINHIFRKHRRNDDNPIYFNLISNDNDLNWNNFNNNIISDNCNKECTIWEREYSCRQCDLDICEECVIKINKTNIRTNHIHKLKIVKSSIINKCNECIVNFNKIIIFFSCLDCDYYSGKYCYKEKIKENRCYLFEIYLLRS